MGCDIHGVFQKKVDRGWEDVETLYDGDRHYALFSILAGVRGFENPIVEPRGFPAGFLVDRANECHNGKWMGEHTYSWLSGQELLAWTHDDQGVVSEMSYFFDEVKRLADLHGEIRFVFGFDN